MTSPEDGFQTVLMKFKKHLKKHDIENFQFTSLEDVKIAIVNIQQDQAKRHKMMNFDRILGFLEAMNQWGKVVEVFLNTTEFLAFVWGPLKFLLQTASAWTDALDVLLDAYQQIAENIPFLQEYRELFDHDSHMRRVLEMVYEDILIFHSKALEVFSKSAWRQIFRAMWSDFNARFKRTLEELSRHKSLVERRATLLDIRIAQSHRLQVLSELEKLEIAQNQRQYRDVMDWLSPTNVSLDQEAAVDVRSEYPETGNWILKAEAMSLWRRADVPPQPKLWLYGKPGAGKTILASVVIEDCLKDSAKDNTIVCAYFYCKHEDRSRNSFLALARSFLAQLLAANREGLTAVFHEKYLSSGQLTLTSTKLFQDLLEIALGNIRRVYLIIDGVDECDRHEWRTICSGFDNQISAVNEKEPGCARVLYISQPEPEIGKAISTSSTMSLEAKDNAKDIYSFVRKWALKIQTRFKVDDYFVTEITDRICAGANGMFLYAKLVATNLEAQPSLALLETEITPSIFPKKISQAYDRIIARINGNDRSESQRTVARKLLGWTVCAKRPLLWHEIQGFISMNVTQQTIDFDKGSLVDDIRDYCGSLIDVLPGKRIQLVHWTARECLISNKTVRKREVDCKLASMCLQYLIFDCFELGISEDDLRRNALTGYLACEDYAVAHWADHVDSFLNSKAESLDSIPSADILELGEAILDFVGYYEELDNETLSEGIEERCSPFRDLNCYTSLLALLNHIRRHRAKGDQFEGEIEISIETLKETFFRNRQQIESLASNSSNDSAVLSKLTTYCGINLFRCPRLRCDYFHEGFPNSRQRDQHLYRHDRPFCCVQVNCSEAQFGFDSRAALEKHVKKYHLDQPSFTKFKTTVTDFKCEICDKVFNRKSNLKSHKKVGHSGERPFRCSACLKAFGTRSDLRRHERVHTGERLFVCDGEMFPDPKRKRDDGRWGCGSEFARPEGLRNHFNSPAGASCLKPLMGKKFKLRANVSVSEMKKWALVEAALKRMMSSSDISSYGDTENSGKYDPDTACESKQPMFKQKAAGEIGLQPDVQEREIGGRVSRHVEALDESEIMDWHLQLPERTSGNMLPESSETLHRDRDTEDLIDEALRQSSSEEMSDAIMEDDTFGAQLGSIFWQDPTPQA